MASSETGGFWTGKTIALAAFLATLTFVGLLAWRVQHGTCEESLVSSHPSPGGGWEAKAFFTDCGLMRGFTTRLALRRAGDPFVPGSRGLVDSGLVLVAGKRLPVTVEWIGDDTLSLSCMGCRKTPMFWVRKGGDPVVRLFDSAGSILERP
jgi:hypothetical protein